MPPIFIITGPPAAGKSTIAKAILQRFDKGLHIPVDDLREWVVSGIAHPVGWTEETTRQFRLAEDGACQVAKNYHDAGFAIAIDHCAGPNSLNDMIERWLHGLTVHRLVLAPTLEANQHRNRTRQGKNFDAGILETTIERLNPMFRSEHPDLQGWVRIDNTNQTIEETVGSILAGVSTPK